MLSKSKKNSNNNFKKISILICTLSIVLVCFILLILKLETVKEDSISLNIKNSYQSRRDWRKQYPRD